MVYRLLPIIGAGAGMAGAVIAGISLGNFSTGEWRLGRSPALFSDQAYVAPVDAQPTEVAYGSKADMVPFDPVVHHCEGCDAHLYPEPAMAPDPYDAKPVVARADEEPAAPVTSEAWEPAQDVAVADDALAPRPARADMAIAMAEPAAPAVAREGQDGRPLTSYTQP